MTGLAIVLLGVGIGYYLYSQKLTKETTSPELRPTGEIRYPPTMIPTKTTEKSQAIYNPERNQIKVQLKPIQKKDFIFVPTPITLDINKIVEKLTRKSLQPQAQQTLALQPQAQQTQETPKPKSIEEILEETINRLEI